MTPILLDTIVAIVIILSTLVAFFRGFVKEALTLVNLAGASAAAYFLHDKSLPFFREWLGITGEEGEKAEKILGVIPPEVMATFLSYAGVFFGVFVILSLAGMAISSSVKALGLGPIDRILGMFFGAARGFLIALLIFTPFRSFLPVAEMPDYVKNSTSVIPLETSYLWAQEYLTAEEDDSEGDEAESAEPDPDSFVGRMQRMAEDHLDDGEPPAETTETPARTDYAKDILTDDEQKTTP